MPYLSPSLSDVHVNRPLTNISVAFVQEEDGFSADKVFPVVPVSKRSDRYFVYSRGEFNRDEMRQRAPGTESAGGTYTIDNTPSYSCDEFAFHRDVPDSIRANADEPIDLDREATLFLTTKFLIGKERLWASTFFITGVWTTERAGVATGPTGTQFLRWDVAASTPIEDVRSGRTAVKLAGGIRPNKLVVGTYVWDALLDHPDIVARIDRGQTSGPAIAMKDSIAAIMELDEILVMDAIYNSAIEGATESNAFIGGNNALLVYAAPRPGIMTPTAGYTFSWTGRFGASALSSRISRFRMEHLKSDRIEIEAAWAHKLVSADLGQMFLNAVS